MVREAVYYRQWDRGEDRWLCTLLLQQGYRVEYCAASDALTYAPEGFNEFFNQRRRWSPSTFANILDLLMSGSRTVKINQNISMLYMVYQGALFASAVLGPSTIFMMMVGALTTAFPSLSLFAAIGVNMAPVGGFFVLCFLVKQDTQLLVAAILSTVYGLVQLLVAVGVAQQIAAEGPCSVSSVFLFFIIGIFITAAFFHPQEFTCILHGFLYYLAIPSMYMFLIIYALCNLHDVSWGTREVVTSNKDQGSEHEEKKEDRKAPPPKENPLISMLNLQAAGHLDGFRVKVGDLCRCLCCPRPGQAPEEQRIDSLIKHVVTMETKMDAMTERLEKAVKEGGGGTLRETSTQGTEAINPVLVTQAEVHADANGRKPEPVKQDVGHDQTQETPSDNVEEITPEDSSQNHYTWIDDPELGDGPIIKLPKKEEVFWRGLIGKYLYPLEGDKEHEAKVTAELKELRNKAVFAFFMIDGMFLVLIFALQIAIDSGSDLTIKWPWQCGGDGTKSEVQPIGFAFIIIFGLILVLQYLGMIAHRLTTFWHVVASTTLFNPRVSVEEEMGGRLMDVKTAVRVAKNMQKLNAGDDDDDDPGSDDGDDISRRLKTVAYKLAKKEKEKKASVKKDQQEADRPKKTRNLDRQFAKNLLALKAEIQKHANKRKKEDGLNPAAGSSNLKDKRTKQAISSIFKAAAAKNKKKLEGQDKLMRMLNQHKSSIFSEETMTKLKVKHEISSRDIEKYRRKLGKTLTGLQPIKEADEELSEASEGTSPDSHTGSRDTSSADLK